jgi:hypothetical protein
MDETDRKGRTRSKSGPGWQIAVVMDFEAFRHVFGLQRCSHRRVLNLIVAGNALDHRIHDAMFVGEKRRKSTACDVAILIDCRRQHSPTVLTNPSRIICAAAEKGDAVRGPCNDHDLGLVYYETRVKVPKKKRRKYLEPLVA